MTKPVVWCVVAGTLLMLLVAVPLGATGTGPQAHPEAFCFLSVMAKSSFEPSEPIGHGWDVGSNEPVSAVDTGFLVPRSREEIPGHFFRGRRDVLVSSGPVDAGSPAGPGRWVPVSCDVLFNRCSSMFESGFVNELTASYPTSRFTASVHDYRTGCVYSLNPELRLTAASVMKAQILAGLLLLTQETGRELTIRERNNVRLMMHHSHNFPPASELYIAVGGANGMEQLDTRFGLTDTVHSDRYGATVTTAADRTRLVGRTLVGGGPLNRSSRETAWEWMSSVGMIQSWGVTAGLPANHRAALKNGFYPVRGGGSWRAGTTGVVYTPTGGAYALTVLTDLNPNEASGIELVEAIARHINAALTVGEAAVRPLDAVTCVSAFGGWSWKFVSERLDYGDPVRLRQLNGGEPAPLAGQRICKL